jgi:ABC-type branched-subunit amino acid transport system ATPase component
VAFRFGIQLLTVSDGTQVEVPTRGVVVFVGPNNAGKSVALRNIHHLLNRVESPPGQEPKVVTGISIVQEGSVEELQEWLDEHAVREPRGFETV